MKASIESMQLVNFKSFKRTSLPLPRGFIAITGPNGSGKSNIIDAIAFVMGWRARRLRASKIDHLVRRGSQSGYVSITINNAAEKYKISREIRPNGESVYRINGRRASASEISQLLSEFGFVTDRYTFVTQGDITSIVEMSPKERAKLLEEISGVAEYDERKLNAVSELQKVDQGLREILVMLKERERELRKAENEWRSLKERRELEEKLMRVKKYVLISELKRLEERLKELESMELEAKFEEVEAIRRELEEKEEELRRLESLVRDSPVRRRRELEFKAKSLKEKIKAIQEALEAKRENLDILMQGETPPLVKEDPSFLGLVSQLIKPIQGYEIPYLAAGGSRLNDIVVRDLDGAKRLAKKLRGVKGRYRIIPLDVILPKDPPRFENSLGPLYNYLEYDEEYEDLARLVFNAVLVRDLDDVTKDLIGKARFVTLDGEIVEREGSILAGSPRKDLERISKIREEISSLQEQLEESESELKSTLEELDNLPKEDPNIDRLNNLRKKVSRLRCTYQEAIRKRQSYLAKMEELSEEKGMIKEQIRSIEHELSKISGIEPMPVPNPHNELAILQTRLKVIGPVNPKAEEEFKLRKARYEEVRRKYEEFQARKKEIEDLIQKIDMERENVIKETLEKLSMAFDESVKSLFGGGGGSLELTDKGLEMKVKLPNKKLLSIDSLSGGEKSLSALAFILAAQKLRPSSLYIFDEADAMLDGINCKRYAKALKDLSKRSQVVVISLKKETLEEADYLIGVTMRNGESKIVAISQEAAS